MKLIRTTEIKTELQYLHNQVMMTKVMKVAMMLPQLLLQELQEELQEEHHHQMMTQAEAEVPHLQHPLPNHLHLLLLQHLQLQQHPHQQV
jgi:hypothetical protein